MIEEVDPLDNDYFTSDELFLSVLADYLGNVDKDSSGYVDEKPLHQTVGEFAIEYLKETKQYHRQFELCLKMFHGKTSGEFNESFLEAVEVLFDQYIEELVDDILQYASVNLNRDKKIDLNFKGVKTYNETLKILLHKKFTDYGTKVLSNHRQPYKCRKARIDFSSKTTREKIEGKLRKLGKYASLSEALEFIKIRIGLFGEYNYKKLVHSLDDLTSDYLFNSSNEELKKSKVKLTTKQLIKDAVKEYEILNSPKYLIDQNAFNEALRNKFNSALKR